VIYETIFSMTVGKWLILIGGFFLCIGLISALWSNRYEGRALGQGALVGFPELAPEEGSLKYKERYAARRRADLWFWGGVISTAVGVFLQTLGSIL
jgi:hypothetical protein